MQTMAEGTADDDILEGFLCPICKADLKSPNQLTSHFESLHKEEQDVLKSLKGIFGKAKKKILNIDESDLKETFDRALKFTATDVNDYVFNEPQELGVTRSCSDFYKAVRSSKLERYAAETNKLLIRLDKLVFNMPSESSARKLHEQDIVPWLEGSSVNLCPGCAKSFNFTRRQHHCRLCGSILCNDCSRFLDLNIAKCMTDPSLDDSHVKTGGEVDDKTGLRLCVHCFSLIELRKQIQDSRNAKTVLVTAYEQMKSLMDQAQPLVDMYEKMCNSLYDGETTYNLSDVNALRGRIGKLAEGIDMLSKQVAVLPVQDPGSKQQKLQTAIRQAAAHYIKEDLLSLRKLPTEAQIVEVQHKRSERAKLKIEAERRRRLEEEKNLEASGAGSSNFHLDTETNSPGNSHNNTIDESPLLEQINIIRDYIKKARQELKFEEVEILENNLKELKKEYNLQSKGL